ncbi:MAG: folate family ECF transporter S component [Synergistales bacterium]|nr:folate family ECF transporter S component [Synergistales bacterium]
MISLNVVLTRFASVRIAIGGIEGIRIGFGAFPAIFTGLTMGPVAGGVVGALGDVTGFFVAPMGAYLPHFTLTAALTGILPPLFWNIAGRREAFLPILTAIVGTQTVTSVVLVPFFLKMLFGLPPAATVPGAAVSLVLATPVYTLLYLKLARSLDLSPAAGRHF